MEVQQLARGFLDLRHATGILEEITSIFRERALLVPLYAADEEMKKVWYHDILGDEGVCEYFTVRDPE